MRNDAATAAGQSSAENTIAPDAGNLPDVSIDLDDVADRALHDRRWRLQYESLGTPFVVTVKASNQSAADSIGRDQLAHQYANFDRAGARLVVCVEA